MVRSLSPALRQELKNLDKDADSRKSAMKALKSYVKDLDSKAIPMFLAQVSETKETGSSSGEYTISLYEVLARVHGPKIVAQIDNIMSTIIKTLTSSAGSFALHQACSKVVPAIARYGIDPTTPDDKKRQIIRSLCKPLSDSLLAKQENLSSGAALCLKALVESDNWRFASGEMVNEVCQRAAGALQKPTQSNSHMALVMALAKHNSLIVEAYARLLIQTGLGILSTGVSEGNSQKRLSAIQMVNFLMKSLDYKSLFSELASIIEEMERCQSDQMAYVKGAAYEALQTAKRIVTEKGSKFDRDTSSSNLSNFSSRESSLMRNLWGGEDNSPQTGSPESQTVESFCGYNSVADSPPSEFGTRSVNRKLWRKYESGGVDVSLKDGLFSELARNDTQDFEQNGFSENLADYEDGFRGFLQSPANGCLRSATPSPQRSRSQISVDNVKIFSTPRKLFRSLQDSNNVHSEFSEKQSRKFRSPSSSKFELSPKPDYNVNGSLHPMNQNIQRNGNLSDGGEQFYGTSESVSSTEDLPVEVDNFQQPEKLENLVTVIKTKRRIEVFGIANGRSVRLFYALLVALFAAFVCLMWVGDQDGGFNVVPT